MAHHAEADLNGFELLQGDSAYDPQVSSLVMVARRIARMRRLRNEYLDADLFAEPSWEMLLDLFCCAPRPQTGEYVELGHRRQCPDVDRAEAS